MFINITQIIYLNKSPKFSEGGILIEQGVCLKKMANFFFKI